MRPDEEVSVRDLRQNLSVHLGRVREGRTLAVTSRGERVAVLAPIGGGSRLERLVAEGRVSTPREPWSAEMPDAAPAGGERALTEAVLALRADDPR